MSTFTAGCKASPYGKFEKTSDMHVERSSLGNPQLFLLKNGRVLVFGGDTYNIPYGKHGTRYKINENVSAEIFDPKTNTFTLKKGLNHGLNHFSATLLNNGQLLITGGYMHSFEGPGFGSDGPVHYTSELYDPETDTVTEGPDMNSPRAYHTAVLLKDGRVLIFGGTTGKRGQDSENKTAEIYDPIQNKFILLQNSPNFTYACSANTNVLSDGKVYIFKVYGYFNKGKPYKIEVFDPKTNEFQLIKAEGQTRSKEEISYYLHETVTLKNDKIVIFADNPKDGHNYNQVDIYDYKTDKLTVVGSTRLKDRKRFEVTLLADDNILITGGVTGQAEGMKDVNTAEILDTKKLKFYPLPQMHSKYYAKTILLNDGRVLIPRAQISEIFIPNESKNNIGND